MSALRRRHIRAAAPAAAAELPRELAPHAAELRDVVNIDDVITIVMMMIVDIIDVITSV